VSLHTPSPWVYVSDFAEVQGAEGTRLVAWTAWMAPNTSNRFDNTGLEVPEWDEMEANARLIAAAPKILNLLERLLDTALPSSTLRVPNYLVEAIKDVLREVSGT